MGQRKRRRKKRREPGPGSDEGVFCRRFVMSSWVQLATISFSHALDNQRGIFVFDVGKAETLSEDEIRIDAPFLTFGEAAPALLDGYSLDPLRRAASEYDPSKEIAVAFLFPAGKCISFIHSQQPPPGELFLESISTPRRGKAARAYTTNN